MSAIEFAVADSAIEGLRVVTLKQVSDSRGTVRELFRRSAFAEARIDLPPFGQINVTRTVRGAVRGMHAEQMTKLVSVVAGAAYAGFVDLRAESPTRGKVVTCELHPGTQVLVPSGVANGFQALADDTEYLYCFDEEWRPGMPGRACTPLDPALGIDWPIPLTEPGQVSDKDRAAPSLSAVLAQMAAEVSV